MKRTLVLAMLLVGAGSAGLAQETGPGHHFLTNWDQDGDGQVTLAEATEKRGLVFTAFDADEDGLLSPEEYALFDEMRATDMEAAKAEMAASGMGKGHGMGAGQGKGMGPGGEEGGMQRGFNDVDGDGAVSRDEFMARTPDWFAMMDRDGDGAVTAADFGRG